MRREYHIKGRSGEDSIGYSTMDEMIDFARQAVIKACDDGEKRKWLGPVELCPYGNMRSQRMRFWALAGSPMRGFVIANYGLSQVDAFDAHSRRLKIRRK